MIYASVWNSMICLDHTETKRFQTVHFPLTTRWEGRGTQVFPELPESQTMIMFTWNVNSVSSPHAIITCVRQITTGWETYIKNWPTLEMTCLQDLLEDIFKIFTYLWIFTPQKLFSVAHDWIVAQWRNILLNKQHMTYVTNQIYSSLLLNGSYEANVHLEVPEIERIK